MSYNCATVVSWWYNYAAVQPCPRCDDSCCSLLWACAGTHASLSTLAVFTKMTCQKNCFVERLLWRLTALLEFQPGRPESHWWRLISKKEVCVLESIILVMRFMHTDEVLIFLYTCNITLSYKNVNSTCIAELTCCLETNASTPRKASPLSVLTMQTMLQYSLSYCCAINVTIIP